MEWLMVERERAEKSGGGGKRVISEMASSSAANQSPRPNIEVAPNYVPYPTALAKYEEVVVNPKLFMDTLEKLHATMGTKFMIPIIGGRDLDLHRLFVEVTARGGIEKIVREKRWKEVTAVFNFPATATNASFVLRKYYLSLIYHYEQIYFFKAKSWSPCADPFQCLSSPPVPSRTLAEPVQPSPEIQAAAVQPPRVNVAQAPPTVAAATSMSPTGSPLVGVIDGKFESGYLVTVKIGSEILKGVLYQAPQNQSCQVQQHHSISSGNNANNHPTTSGVVRRRRRKKSEIKKRDPAHPKPNRSGYNFFFKEQHARLKPLHPGKDRDISRMIGELWTKMQETEKQSYQDKAMKDKERYKMEMADYKERLRAGQTIGLRAGQTIGSVVPIQQRPLLLDTHMAETSEKIETESGESPQSLENEISTSKSDSEDNTEDKDFDMEASFEVEGCSENKRTKYSVEDEGGFDMEKNVDMVGEENLDTLGDVILEESGKDFAPSGEKGAMLCEGKNPFPDEDRDSIFNERNKETEKESVPLEDKGATPCEGKEWFSCEKRDSVASEENVESVTQMKPLGKKGAMPHEGKELSPSEKREEERELVASEERGKMPCDGIESPPREKRDSLSSKENAETEIVRGPLEDKGARPCEGKETSLTEKRDSKEQNAETEKS